MTALLDGASGPTSQRESVLAEYDVSRETSERLDTFVAVLLAWQRKLNLIGSSTIETLWHRHVADALQLWDIAVSVQGDSPATGSAAAAEPCDGNALSRSGDLAAIRDDDLARVKQLLVEASRKEQGPEEKSSFNSAPKKTGSVWVDLGSGGGFPGMVIACVLGNRPGAHVHLTEKSPKKSAFLREAVLETKVAATVHTGRIEDIGPQLSGIADVVTARALAPLDELLGLAAPVIRDGAFALLQKGRNLEAELSAATKGWIIDGDVVQSRTDPGGRILIVRALLPRSALSPRRA